MHRELVALMSPPRARPARSTSVTPPAVILLAGLQGAGKTTTAGKAALKHVPSRRKGAAGACDVYRPAATEQLKTLAGQVEVDFYAGDASAGTNPVAIAHRRSTGRDRATTTW